MGWGAGGSVEVGKTTASSILFARNGSGTVRQVEVCETVEVRGLTAANGKKSVPDAADKIVDNTNQVQYWAHIDGATFSISVVTGSKEEWGAARRDDSGQWVATKTTHTYFATGLDEEVWGTSELDEDGDVLLLSASGRQKVVSKEMSTSFVMRFGKYVLCSTITTTVVEYRYVDSEGHALAIVAAHNSTAVPTTVHSPTRVPDPAHPGTNVPISYAWTTIPLGTEEFAEAHFVSASRGWSVSVTRKDYGKTGDWS